MLTRFHKILIAVLAVQLVLVAVVVLRGSDVAPLKEHVLVSGFDVAKVTRVQIFSGADAKPVDLVKRDSNWVLASGFDYPVDGAKVTELLMPIPKLTAAAPMATSTGRHKQLHVADGDFERKLVITSDGKDLTLFIGTGAGLRRTAIRLGGQDNVFAVIGLSVASASADVRQWVDPAYLKIPTSEITQVVISRDGKTVELAHVLPTPAPGAGSGSAAGSGAEAGSGAGSGSSAAPVAESWSATLGGAPIALAAGESLDTAAIERLIGQVATIDLSAPADPKRDASKPTATITIERKPAGATSAAPIVVDVVADGTSYWVHDRSSSRAALVDKNRLDDVLNAGRDKLVKKPPPPPPPLAPAPGAGSGAAARPGTGSAARPG